MQPTPLAASGIDAILHARICYNAITIYQCGAADAQAVSPQAIKSVLDIIHLSCYDLPCYSSISVSSQYA